MEVIIEDETQQLIRLVVGYGIWDSLTHVGIARMQNTRGRLALFLQLIYCIATHLRVWSAGKILFNMSIMQLDRWGAINTL